MALKKPNAWIAVLALPILAGAATPEVSPKREVPHQGWIHHVFGRPAAYARTAAYAGIEQLRGEPREWGGGVSGYAKRFGSVFGKHITKSSIQYGVAKLRDEQLGYTPSGKKGFTPRLKYALISTVVTRKTTTGQRTVSTSEISAVIGSGLISRLWQPARLRTFGSGFSSAGISLGSDAGYNVVREFWPEIRHPRQAKERKARLQAQSLGGTRRPRQE